jgi:hypothetical protein
MANVHRKRTLMSFGTVAVLTMIAAAATVACGDDDAEPEDSGGTSGSSTTGGAPGDSSGSGGLAGQPGDADPAYLIGTRVWVDTTATSYFNVVSSLDKGTEVSREQALELPGPAKLYAIPDVGWFGLGGGEEPTITRYGLSADGKLQKEKTINMLSYGVQGLWDNLYVVSKTKIYYPDRDNRQLIIINPTEMAIEGAIKLPETAQDGFLSLYGYTPLLRGNKLLFTVGWFDWNVNDSVLGETGLVVLDTDTDTVDSFDIDKRCGGITTGVTTADGDTYFVSSALAGVAHRLGRQPTAPCALRVKAGAEAFEEDYLVELGELTNSEVAGEPVPAGGNGIFLRAFEESEATFTEESATYELTGQTAWYWWRWNVETGEASLVDELEPSTSDVLWFEVGGRVFGSQTTADYAETTLIELTAEGGPREALTAPGFLHGIARIR